MTILQLQLQQRYMAIYSNSKHTKCYWPCSGWISRRISMRRSQIKGDAAIKKMIDDALANTTVTDVCLTYGTATRRYIQHEINKSLERGKGLLGLQIHGLKDLLGYTTSAGSVQYKVEAKGLKGVKFTTVATLDRMAYLIEEAANNAGKKIFANSSIVRISYTILVSLNKGPTLFLFVHKGIPVEQ